MHFNHRGIDYTLEDDWWAEAGMASFRPGRRSYRAGPSEFRDLVTFEVAIDDVQPLNRKASHGVFNDSEPGRREGSARERVVRILKWFRDDAPVEPGAWRGCQRGLAAGSNWLMARIVSIAPSPPATPTFRQSKSTTSGLRLCERPGTRVFACQRPSVHPHVRAKRATGALTGMYQGTGQVCSRFGRANWEEEKPSDKPSPLIRRPLMRPGRLRPGGRLVGAVDGRQRAIWLGHSIAGWAPQTPVSSEDPAALPITDALSDNASKAHPLLFSSAGGLLAHGKTRSALESSAGGKANPRFLAAVLLTARGGSRVW